MFFALSLVGWLEVGSSSSSRLIFSVFISSFVELGWLLLAGLDRLGVDYDFNFLPYVFFRKGVRQAFTPSNRLAGLPHYRLNDRLAEH